MNFSCDACERRFSSHAAFAGHRVGTYTTIPPNFGRRCLDAEEMELSGYALRDGVWERPGRRSDHTGRHHTDQAWQGPSSASQVASGGTP